MNTKKNTKQAPSMVAPNFYRKRIKAIPMIRIKILAKRD